MNTIIVKRGTYAGTQIQDREFKMVLPPKVGKKGLYVTVLGDPLGYPERKIRVMLEQKDDVKFLEGNTQDTDLEHAEESQVQESDEEIMKRMRKKFSVLDGMTYAAIEGHVRAMIVAGPPGVGKSYGIESILESLAFTDTLINSNFSNGVARRGIEKVAGASALGLYQLLWEYRAEGSLLVLDDSDTVLYDETTLNMLKAVTDTGSRRRLTWRTESRVLAEAGIDTEFEFKGAVIFITNLNFEKTRGKTGDHLQAIMSRCHYLDIGIQNVREKFLRCKQIVRDGMLDRYKFDDVQKDEILTYIEQNKSELRELSLRMVIKIADLAKMDPNGWRDYADQTCLKGR